MIVNRFASRAWALLSLLALLASCEGNNDTPEPEFGDGDIVVKVADSAFADGSHNSTKADDQLDTRASMEEAKDGLKFLWTRTDDIALYTDGAAQKLSLSDGVKTSSASFTGATLESGKSYKMFYPYTDGSADAVSVDYSGQKLGASGSTANLYTPLYASASANTSGGAQFNASHLSAYTLYNMEVPVNANLTTFTLIPTYDEIGLTGNANLSNGAITVETSTPILAKPLSNVSTSSKNKKASFWLSMIPHDFSKQTFAAVIEDEFGEIYTAQLSGKNLQAGKSYGWDETLVKYDNTSASSLKLTSELSDASTVQTNISAMGVEYGQYSGITHITDNRYAIAHDQHKGGGIQFMELTFDAKGNVTSAKLETPAATKNGAASRDVEGIVYVPSTNTIFTCGENYQDILEYDLEGKPTGRKMTIPEDMSVKMTQNNQGFESLAYSEKTGLFWTTTEAPLQKDMDVFNKKGRLIRLQSFKSDLTPGDRRFYLIDKPEIEDGVNSATYGYGVSDMLALDDGKLIVMEREVYVNVSSLKIWCKVKLYVVDPVNDKAGILSKSLLASFKTSTGALADYEGMCFGPTLADGTKTILLICDSAGGKSYSGFRLSDYILTIAYK